LAPACVPFGSIEAFKSLSDKATLSRAARAAGIAYPAERVVTWDERNDLAPDQTYPVVIKPSRSVNDGTKHTVKYAADSKELSTRIAALPKAAFPLLLQERIVGPGTGVFLLMWDDKVVARFAHRRIREKPPSGGVSVYSESIALDPSLADASTRLLHTFGWRGVAMVEYKRDAASGTPFLMEINGRFWGSLQLAIDAGVDFPALLVDTALGRRGDRPPPDYRSGVRARWWWGDVDHLIARLRRGPSRGGAVVDFLRAGFPVRDNVWRAADPAPFVYESLSWIRGR
jgi:predicted ATP-grasp superfamily ATP-dependent carboligase